MEGQGSAAGGSVTGCRRGGHRGSRGRVQDAWAGASEWSRDSRIIGILAKELDLEANEVDKMSREADAIKS